MLMISDGSSEAIIYAFMLYKQEYARSSSCAARFCEFMMTYLMNLLMTSRIDMQREQMCNITELKCYRNEQLN